MPLSGVPCWVHADRVQMEQTLINLVLNARDAMPEGRQTGSKHVGDCKRQRYRRHEISPHAAFRAGDYALITIADTGQGIPEQLLGRTQPFFTTKTRERERGWGFDCSRHCQPERRPSAGEEQRE